MLDTDPDRIPVQPNNMGTAWCCTALCNGNRENDSDNRCCNCRISRKSSVSVCRNNSCRRDQHGRRVCNYIHGSKMSPSSTVFYGNVATKDVASSSSCVAA